jgi:putative phage-type endonuclease
MDEIPVTSEQSEPSSKYQIGSEIPQPNSKSQIGRSEIAQNSFEWHNSRKKTITSTNVPAILEFDEYRTRHELYQSKKKELEYIVVSDNLNDPTVWGNKFEPIARELTEKRYNITINTTGLKYHKEYEWLGASPDGIGDYPNHSRILFEFKSPIWRKLSQEIPFSYWIQTQIQMEVWDIDYCLYSEHKFALYDNKTAYELDNRVDKGVIGLTDPISYWYLINNWDVMIKRDREWFNKVLPYLKTFYTEMTDNKLQATDWSGYVHTLDTTNYVLKDCLLDWLNQFGSYHHYIRDKPREYSLHNFVIEKTNEFRMNFFNYIKTNHPFIDISDDPLHPIVSDYKIHIKYINKSDRNIANTVDAINKKIPIIINGCVYNPIDKTYGRIDLLVLADYFNKVFNTSIVLSGQHYVMVEVKYSNLNLCSNGINLLNNNKQKVYKAHSTLLNCGLNYITNHYRSQSYVVGRKSTYKSKGIEYTTLDFLSSIGVIDYDDYDKNYLTIYRDTLSWLQNLKNGKNWDIFNPCNELLRPNMKNIRDNPWGMVKKLIAEKNAELTSLLYLGVNQRNMLCANGINNWHDLSDEIIDKYRLRESNTIKNMLHCTRENKILNIENISIEKSNVEFYIDFETVSDLDDNFDELPRANGTEIIYMIGTLMKNNVTGESSYYNHLVNRLTKTSEREMIKDWLNWLNRHNNQYRSGDKRSQEREHIHLFHWSSAEKVHLEKALDDDILALDLEMIDLYKLFRDHKVTIPGVFRNGLKDVARGLHKLGKLNTVWTDNFDGSQAMVAAWKANEIAVEQGKTLSDITHIMKPVIDYNYIDCKTLEEIVTFIRLLNSVPYHSN